ncbi:hypothetical protein [Methanobacterium sp.]|uniref:hypothetical protein n=1 Tax=Methanobacterium sp. TaxID=2164 RepID=UPI003C746BB1
MEVEKNTVKTVSFDASKIYDFRMLRIFRTFGNQSMKKSSIFSAPKSKILRDFQCPKREAFDDPKKSKILEVEEKS